MTYTRQGRTYTLDGTPLQNTFYGNRTTDNDTTKKRFLTNSDKSVFNLRWEVGGVAEENYQRSRSHSHHEKNSPRHHSHKHHRHNHHHHHYHHYPQEETEFNDEPIPTPYPAPSYPTPLPPTPTPPPPTPPPEPIAYYYPYAYPPMPVYEEPEQSFVEEHREVIKPQRTNRTTTTTTRKGKTQTEKSVNFLPGRSKLKIDHYYVDSPNEAQKLINNLRRQGFVETGITTPALHPDKKKK